MVKFKKTKLRTTYRNNLPFGKYNYIVTFNMTILNCTSNKYNLGKSTGKLVEFSSNNQRRRVRKANTKTYNKTRTKFNIDQLEDLLRDAVIGKCRMQYNIRARLPLRLYFTDYEDITYLYFNYKKFIGRVHKVELIPKSS